MLLAIDVGNTQTVLGAYSGETLLHQWRIATGKQDTPDELRIALKQILEADELSLESIRGAALASVVPRLTEAWQEAVQRACGVTPIVCTAKAAGALFETDYPNPHEIGADRIADAVAARARLGSPVVVVDFGTATNIEVINEDGLFIGGIIAPGVETSSQALFSRATKLGQISLADPGINIGRNTEEAIRIGVVYGEAARVDGLVRRIFDQLGYITPVIATGGLASRMQPHCETITCVMPDLTLEGLRLIHENNAKATSA